MRETIGNPSVIDVSGPLKNLQHEKFCHAYVLHRNATEAAKIAEYSEKTARSSGSRLLTRDDIVERVMELSKGQTKKLIATRERVIEEMARIAIGDVRKLFDQDGNMKRPHEMDDEAAAVFGATIVKQRGAMLDKLGQHFNIYEDHQKAGTGEIHVHIDEKDSKL